MHLPGGFRFDLTVDVEVSLAEIAKFALEKRSSRRIDAVVRVGISLKMDIALRCGNRCQSIAVE
jgi:hypothetical protein